MQGLISTGYIPVFADATPDTINVSVERIKTCTSEHMRAILFGQVPYRSLTLGANVPAAWDRARGSGRALAAEVVRPGVLRVTTPVRDGTQAKVRPAQC